MSLLPRLLFGTSVFAETEEFLEFRFKFVCVLMFVGSFFGLLFLVLHWFGLIQLRAYHVVALEFFCVLSQALWFLLRGHKEWFLPLVWCFEALVFSISISAWMLVPQDELRILWLFLNLPPVFLILGQRAGLAVTALTMLTLVLGNSLQQTPYSSHALITAIVTMAYLAMLLYVQNSRSKSYLSRMLAYNAQLKELVIHDPLTGVLNARGYNEACSQQLAQAQRAGTSSTVLFIDLDHFKFINDNYGHMVGDEVLKAVAKCIKKNVRKTDVVGRVGGEEFCVFLPNTIEQNATELAENLRFAIESLMPQVTMNESGTQPSCLKVTASIGVASNTNWHESMQIIQQRADTAMYAAKQQGRNRVSVLSPSEPELNSDFGR